MSNNCEIKNRIIQLEAGIEQMKSHELFNEMEIQYNLKIMNTELEDLQLQLLNQIEVNQEKEL
jgi:hypothetical protein